MMSALRFQSLATISVLSCAAGLASAAGGAKETTDEALPGIFAPKKADEAPRPPELLARRLPASSDKISAAIRERVMERAKTLHPAALPIARREGEMSAVVMEAFTVKADKVRRVAPEEQLSPAARFLKTGRFFESADGTLTGDARLLPVRPAGALPKENVPRVEISITKKF